MKKLISAAAALLLIFCLAACKTQPTEVERPTEAPTVTEAPEDPTEAPADPTEAPADPTEMTLTVDADDPKLIEAAWAAAEKIGEVHRQKFDKDGAEIRANAYFAEVRFPSVDYPDERLCMTVEPDPEEGYKVDWESAYFEHAEEDPDKRDARFGADEITEKQEEFRNARIEVTADEIRASGCEAEIGSDEYKLAAASVYGEKLAECYSSILGQDTPFSCYEIRCVGTEAEKEYKDGFIVSIGFRARDILPLSHLFDYPYFDDGAVHPGYEGWLVGWTVVTVDLENDGSFVCNAVLNGAGW